jgi:signal transduction histidine kinase
VDVLPFVEKVVNVFRSDPQSRGRAVRLPAATEPARWLFDEGQIRQALLALLRSASAEAPADAPLEIALAREGGAAGFQVRHVPEIAAPPRTDEAVRAAGEAPAEAGAAASVGLLGQEIGRVAAEAHGGRLVVQGTPGRATSLTLWIGDAVPGEKAA